MYLEGDPWWGSPTLWAALALVTIFPFLFVDLPPLTDLPNHFARYYIFLHLDQSAFLSNYYSVHWFLNGNLGVDLIVRALAPVLGLESAVRVVVGAIPALTVFGIYSVSRSMSGQVMPSALLALPLTYNWPLISGFVNFSLSAAIALLVFALWVRLRKWPYSIRLAIFAPLALATWIAHVAGWGLLGLAVGGFEIQRAMKARETRIAALFDVVFQVLPFAAVILLVFFWRTGGSSALDASFSPDILKSKLISLLTLLREQYLYWDFFSSIVLLALAVAVFFFGGCTLIAPTSIVAALYFLAFLLCPDGLFGGWFVDRRILPYAAILAALSIGTKTTVLADQRRRIYVSIVSLLAIALFVARIAVTTSVWHDVSGRLHAHLALLRSIPNHSRVFSLFVQSCEKAWPRGRLDHLQQLVIPLRQSMTNGQFQEGNLNQLHVLFRKPVGFDPNVGSAVYDGDCQGSALSFQSIVSVFPRQQFDLVWLASETELPIFNPSGLILIDAFDHDRLYRIDAR